MQSINLAWKILFCQSKSFMPLGGPRENIPDMGVLGVSSVPEALAANPRHSCMAAVSLSSPLRGKAPFPPLLRGAPCCCCSRLAFGCRSGKAVLPAENQACAPGVLPGSPSFVSVLASLSSPPLSCAPVLPKRTAGEDCVRGTDEEDADGVVVACLLRKVPVGGIIDAGRVEDTGTIVGDGGPFRETGVELTVAGEDGDSGAPASTWSSTSPDDDDSSGATIAEGDGKPGPSWGGKNDDVFKTPSTLTEVMNPREKNHVLRGQNDSHCRTYISQQHNKHRLFFFICHFDR